MCLQITLYANQTHVIMSVCMFAYDCTGDEICRKKKSTTPEHIHAGLTKTFLLQENKSPTTEHVSQNRIEKLQ